MPPAMACARVRAVSNARALVDEEDLIFREGAAAVPRELMAAGMPRGRIGRTGRHTHRAE
jgi:hypothetical protein